MKKQTIKYKKRKIEKKRNSGICSITRFKEELLHNFRLNLISKKIIRQNEINLKEFAEISSNFTRFIRIKYL